MESNLFIPVRLPRQPLEALCTDCGQPFRPRWVGDGAEELCDLCYEARFRTPPVPLRQALAEFRER